MDPEESGEIYASEFPDCSRGPANAVAGCRIEDSKKMKLYFSLKALRVREDEAILGLVTHAIGC